MVDDTHRLAVALAQTREQASVTGVVCRLRNERDAARGERDEARRVAQQYYHDIEALVAEYQWLKHWANDCQELDWLKALPHA